MTRHSVLIVDDEQAVRTGWEKALRHAGYQVFSAASAEKALQLCDEHSVDVVVLDFIMPSVDGVRLLIQMRKRLPFVRSLIVSGKIDTDVSSSDITSELKAEVEADMYLHKPISNDDLRNAVKTLLDAPAPADWKTVAQKASHTKEITAKKAERVSKVLKARRKRR